MGGGMRGRRLAALKSANESREPKFVIAARELVRAAPSLRPQYSRNPLCAPCDGAEFSESVGARWAADARALCDWDAMPPALDVAHPEGGAVPADRGARKRQQLLNVALFVAPALRLNPRARVVDFGAGGGHQTLFLARAFPEASFALVDLKRRSLDVAERRVQRAGLANVRVVHGRIEDFREDFDVGVALHACGGASDAALARCVEKKATFVVAPCCVGKIASAIFRAGTEPSSDDARDDAAPADVDAAHADTDDVGITVGITDGGVPRVRVSQTTYPRSLAARRVLTGDRYVAVARAADSSAAASARAEAKAADAFGVASRGASLVADLHAPDSSEEEEDARLEGILEAREYTEGSPPDSREETRVSRGEEEDTKTLSLGERRMRAARLEKRLRKRPGAPRASASVTAERDTQRRACKLLIESDRLAAAREAGYRTWLAGMHPGECTPKNDVLVGVFADSAERADGDDGEEAAARRRLLEEYEEGLGVLTDPPAKAFFESLID